MANKKKEKKDAIWFWLIIIALALICLCIMVIAGVSFQWEHPIEWRNPNFIVDQELLGTLGDFVGGVAGTIVAIISTILLISTFWQQQKVTKSDDEESKIKRFNVLFFELLHLYQSEVNELCGERERTIKIEEVDNSRQRRVHKEHSSYNNKDFFDEEKLDIQESYKASIKSFEGSRKRVIEDYMRFYTKYRSKIAAYYRTLYRVYELIDKTDLIDNDHKRQYAKIIRAQLTESELFFIRYNARTLYGKPFIEYINKYNTLKHLPVFELLEFKNWWGRMCKIDQEGINMIYFTILKALKDLYKNYDKNKDARISLWPNNASKCKYHFDIYCKKRYDIALLLTIDNDIQLCEDEYRGFTKLTSQQIQQLLECFLKEIFIYSNFSKFNDKNDLEVSSIPIITDNNKTIIRSYIKNTKFKEINFFDPKKDKE